MARSLKILYHHRVVAKDGQDVHITEMIAAMRRQGHQVTMVAPPIAEAPIAAGVAARPNLLGRARKAMPRWLHEALENVYSLIAFCQLLVAWRRSRPDLIYERYNLFCWSGLWLHRLTGLPYILEVNSPLVWERSRHGGLALQRFAAWTEASLWRNASLVLPVTEVLAARVRAAGVSSERILVLPNGVDRGKFVSGGENRTLRSQLGLADKLVLGFTGFVREWHGLPRVIDALAGFEDRDKLHFLVIGDGPGLKALQDHAGMRGMRQHLTCLGLVPRDQIVGLTECFDIALQPEVVDYASPLKLLEYMALGRAILAPDQPNIRELLSPGENALLFDPADPSQFQDRLAELIADEKMRRRLAQAASATIEAKRLTWDDNVLKMLEAMEKKQAYSDRSSLGA